MIKNYLPIFLILLLFIYGCSQPTPGPEPVPTPTPGPTPQPNPEPEPTPIPPEDLAASDEKADAVDKSFTASNSEFAFNVFKELIEEDKDQNIFISPFSISTALTMTYNGAEGTTKDAMEKTLKFGSDIENTNKEYKNLIESLDKVDSKIKLTVSNSIWVNKSFEPSVKQDFKDRLNGNYNSDILARDFTDSKTADEINSWIDKSTNGKITKMIDKIGPELVMFLINAIYFKGEWTEKFDEKYTKKEDFFLSDGNPIKVDMMSNNGEFDYLEEKHFQAVRLPYGRGKIAMYIFLPNKGVEVDTLIKNLDPNSFEKFRSEDLEELKVPKFKIEYGKKRLNDILKKQGMEVAFDKGDANLRGIATLTPQQNLYISFVDHKAVIEVNEEGSEAAAATVIGIGMVASAAPGIPLKFIADRPFFFVIRDDRSGTILFMGKLVDPSKSS